MGRLIDLDKVEFLKVDGNIEFNHGVDCCINRLLKQPLVEVIPKADYENRLKADMVAMLTDMLIDVEEIESREQWCDYANDNCISRYDVEDLIQKKINALKAETEEI